MHFAHINTRNVDISVNFNANVLLSFQKGYRAMLHYLEVEYNSFEQNQQCKVKNTLLVKSDSSARIKTRNVGISVKFNAKVLLSLPKGYRAILHHLEGEYIRFEQNQQYKVKNTLLVKKWF